MRIHRKDLFWIIILVVSGLLFLNIFIQANAHQYPSLGKQPPTQTTKNTDKAFNLSNLISKFNKEENNYAPIRHLELLGTVIGSPSLASIYNLDSGKQGLYKLNDDIGGLKLVDILPGKVILEKDGAEWELLLSADNQRKKQSAIFTDESGTIIVDKFQVLGQILKANELITKIKIFPIPDTVSNKLMGFRIDNIPSGSIIEEAGIKSGDIICAVQGKKLQSMQDALVMFEKVQNDSRIEVVLLRQEKPITLNYEIKK